MTMDWLPSWEPGDISAGVIVALIVFFLLTGRLTTRRHVEDVRKDTSTQLARADAEYEKRQATLQFLVEELSHERDDWKAAARESEQHSITLTSQMGELLEGSRATIQLIQSLPNVGGGHDDG